MHPIHDGVRAFQTERLPALRDHFKGLASGQSPHTLFITCSDSRIDPALITSAQPGQIFVSRNAGNLAPPYGEDVGTASAIEYAVAALKVEQIVVCGHSGCGAMGGLLAPESLEALPQVAAWVRHAEATRAAVAGEAHPLPAAVRHNAATQLENLRTHPTVAAALEAGTLRLEAWVYDIPTGEINIVSTVEGA